MEMVIVFYGPNNTYKALRIVGTKYSLYYSVWCTNEHELYDLIVSTFRAYNIELG
jgi:N-acetylglucosamine-6-sulfatase